MRASRGAQQPWVPGAPSPQSPPRAARPPPRAPPVQSPACTPRPHQGACSGQAGWRCPQLTCAAATLAKEPEEPAPGRQLAPRAQGSHRAAGMRQGKRQGGKTGPHLSLRRFSWAPTTAQLLMGAKQTSTCKRLNAKRSTCTTHLVLQGKCAGAQADNNDAAGNAPWAPPTSPSSHKSSYLPDVLVGDLDEVHYR